MLQRCRAAARAGLAGAGAARTAVARTAATSAEPVRTGCMPGSLARAAQHDLRAHEVRGEPLAVADADLPDLGAAADVQGLADRVEGVAVAAGGEDVDLQLDGGEVETGLEVAHRAPGGDGVGEGGPRAAVDVAARVQVAAVDDHAADDAALVDVDELDAEVAGEGPGQDLAAELGCDRGIHGRRKDASPSPATSTATPAPEISSGTRP